MAERYGQPTETHIRNCQAELSQHQVLQLVPCNDRAMSIVSRQSNRFHGRLILLFLPRLCGVAVQVPQLTT